MSERFTQGQSFVWLQYQHLSDEIEKILPVLVASVLLWYIFMQRLAILPNVLAVLRVLLPVQGVVVGEVPRARLHRHPPGNGARDALHHGKMFAVVVGLEQGAAHGDLEDDAAGGPDVAGLGPADLHDDLGRPVVACGHDAGVVLVVEGRAPEVNQPNFGVVYAFHRLSGLVVEN